MSSVFYPKLSYIASISQGVQTTVTFTDDCDFTPGEVISFRVSKQNGMYELNNVQSSVVSNDTNSIVVNIDSRNFNAFVFTPSYEGSHPAMVVPAGSGIIPNSIPLQTSLIDAFDNIPVN